MSVFHDRVICLMYILTAKYEYNAQCANEIKIIEAQNEKEK